MKTLNELTERDLYRAIDAAHANANGKIVGYIPGGLKRRYHNKIQCLPINKGIQFIHTPSFSGAIIIRRHDVVLGCSNFGGAGRGYVFGSLDEIRQALK